MARSRPTAVPIAVLASGVLAPYPPENDKLADEIAAHGCVVSEAPPTMPPIAGMFPQRNRIISGLTLGTIVVEASSRSGGADHRPPCR